MDHRTIGSLDVSVVGLGCNQFGTKSCDESAAFEVVNEALTAGITYFDTADEYGMDYSDSTNPDGWGASEEILGRAIKAHRDEVVIATKFGSHPHGDESRGGNSARWIATALEDSLRRLGTDHIDLYQIHFPDPGVPVEETISALVEAKNAGKVREIGCCNYTAAGLGELVDVAKQADIRFVSDQDALNVLRRSALDEILPFCQSHDMAFIPYFPLASGVLTGKYRRGQVAAPGTRLADQVDDSTRARMLSDRTFARLDALEEFAAHSNHSLLELAFGWLLGHPSVATVISGAARPGQSAANAAAATWQLTSDEVATVTRIVEAAA